MTLHRLRIAGLLLALLWPGVAAAAEPGIRVFIGSVTDPARDRTLPYRIFHPDLESEEYPLILVSHGGIGNHRGHLQFDHLGEAFARAGFVSLHINHRPSLGNARPVRDRPADASHLLDRLEAGDLPMPERLSGRVRTERVGMIGHSFGAYTAHALAGARFEHGSYRDDRIACIIAISPQGEGNMGAFDRGPADNSWQSVTIPAFCMVGSEEIRMAAGRDMGDGWRLRPFKRYPTAGNKYLAVLEGQSHAQMGTRGSTDTGRYIARNACVFFEVYLLDRTECEPEIGTLDAPPGLHFVRKHDALTE